MTMECVTTESIQNVKNVDDPSVNLINSVKFLLNLQFSKQIKNVAVKF